VLIDAVGQQLLINYFFGMRFAVILLTAESFLKGRAMRHMKIDHDEIIIIEIAVWVFIFFVACIYTWAIL